MSGLDVGMCVAVLAGLLLAGCGSKAEPPGSPVVEIHEVGDLTSPHADPHAPYAEVTVLAARVERIVDPTTWRSTPGAEVRPFDAGRLLVRAAPRVQSAVRAYLDGLRQGRGLVVPDDVPVWARVAPEQIAEARRHDVPVAFENDLGMRFVLIPAGTFLMGSPPREKGRDWDEVQQTVRISRPFYLQTTEVTNAQFRRWKPEHDSDLTEWGHTLNGDAQPVQADYPAAFRFAAWLSREDAARDYRLPTEAEWEYACRARTRGPTFWGSSNDEARRYENHAGALCQDPQASSGRDPPRADGFPTTAPVGSFLPNPWGLYDMLGNMDEWCSDFYAECPWSSTDLSIPQVDPTGPAATGMHVVRSSFCLATPDHLRCANRAGLDVQRDLAAAGLRLVSPLPEAGP